MRFRGSFLLLYIFLIMIYLFTTNGCAQPCVSLSQQLCSCENSPEAQRACVQRVNNEASLHTPSEAQSQQCRTLENKWDQNECTCETLPQIGQWAACGLAKE